MDDKLYAECEAEFGKISDILEGDPSPMEIRHAHTLAWRMHSRLEEFRNRYIFCSQEA